MTLLILALSGVAATLSGILIWLNVSDKDGYDLVEMCMAVVLGLYAVTVPMIWWLS